ncbi:MAG: tetratricopeptide repeat protein, partial [Gammaproteobacteria bacterium]
ALQASQDLTGAVAAYRRALAADPQSLEAHLQLANIQLQQGDLQEAADSYRRALATRPDHFQAQLRLADVQRRLGKLDEAASHCRAALALDPGAVEGHYHLGLILQEQGDLAGAEASLHHALQIAPESAGTWNNLGLVLQQAERRDEAEDAYRRALSLDANQPEAHRNLANRLRETGRYAEAGKLLDHAVELDPRAAEPHWDRALLWLLQGDFEHGWPEYEWRWQGEGVPRRDFGLPPWQGANLADLGILVYAEQGVGDEIMFASCLPDLMERARHVVLDCDPRLAPLFRRSFPAATVHGGPQDAAPDWLRDAPAVDVQIAVGSLPLYLRRRREDFPCRGSYLAAAQQAVRKWRQRYEDLGAGLKIGISWRGGRGSQKTQRSTRLEQWRDLLSLAGTHWINVQYGDCHEELAHAQTQLGVEIHHWEDADPLRDLDDFAAQIAALDLVISIDNSTVHLAGALGVEVWTLQPHAPDWRWLAAGSDCHWYPSLRHFRQPRAGDWGAVFQQAVAVLRERLQAAEGPAPNHRTGDD